MGKSWVRTWMCKKDKLIWERGNWETLELSPSQGHSNPAEHLQWKRKAGTVLTSLISFQIQGAISDNIQLSLMSFCPGSWTAPRFSLKVKDIPAGLGLQRSSVVRGFVRNQGPACTSDRKYSPLLILKLEQKVALTNKTKLQILASFHKFQRSLMYHSSKTLKLFHDKMVVGRERILLVWNRELQSPGCANLKWVHFLFYDSRELCAWKIQVFSLYQKLYENCVVKLIGWSHHYTDIFSLGNIKRSFNSHKNCNYFHSWLNTQAICCSSPSILG